VRLWEKPFALYKYNGGLNKQQMLPSIIEYISEQEELDYKLISLYIIEKMINHLIYKQI